MAGWFLFCLCPGPAQPELRFQESVVQKILKQENQSGEPGEGRQDMVVLAGMLFLRIWGYMPLLK